MPADRDARDALVVAHAGWARKVALQVVRRLRIRIDPDEGVSAALLALVEVAGRYRVGEAAVFTTYAHRRIEGAVLDHAHVLSGAYRLGAGAGRTARLYPAASLPLDVVANELRGPDQREGAEARHDVGRLLAVLSAREREVLRLIYVEDVGLAEVGRRLGVSESRACQISREAVVKMRAVLGDPSGIRTCVRGLKGHCPKPG